jgi:hypothetical protein
MDRVVVLALMTTALLWMTPSCSCSASSQGQTTLAGMVSQDGITWTFSEKVPVGRFVAGDYYVVGAVTITGISPAPTPGRNGSVLNVPPRNDRSGFDDRAWGNRWDPSLRAELPIHMRPGDALISSISVDEVGRLMRPLNSGEKTVSPVLSVSVLTCLDKAVGADAFRPSYCRKPAAKGQPAQTPTIYLARNLRRDLLPKVQGVKDNPKIEEWVARYQRPWLDIVFFGFDMPIQYMPDYGRELGMAAGISTLMLMVTDYPQEQKDKLLIGVVQRGIDLWGIVEAGGSGWEAWGGHGTGRKWPIVFAGIMLGDTDMQSPYKKYPNLKFGEDMQTIYGEGWTGDTALYGGHRGADGESLGGPGRGAYEHLQPREWKSMMNESYRRCCTSVAWVAQALAIRLMHAEEIWDHPAFFDYVDRWMTKDDTEAIRIIKEETGQDFSASWQRQGQAWDGFTEEMWAKYRGPVDYGRSPK